VDRSTQPTGDDTMTTLSAIDRLSAKDKLTLFG
jgi:hypothetical protein